MFLKICGIQTQDELELAIRAGVDAVGFVSTMPDGPGQLPLSEIRRLSAHLAGRVRGVLLTSERSADAVLAQADYTRLNSIQLCRPMERKDRQSLRAQGLEIFTVVHITGPDAIPAALATAEESDFLTLDSSRPNATLGGTGQVHDWNISREISERVSLPVILAGGIHANNVAIAQEAVRPFGIDVQSGVRSGGQLCAQKLSQLMGEIRRPGRNA